MRFIPAALRKQRRSTQGRIVNGDGHPRGARYGVAAAGCTFVLAGLTGISRVLLGKRDGHLLQISTTTVVIGVVLIGQSILSKRPAAEDQTYKIGYDMGYEKGEQDERERTRPKLVVAEITKKVWHRR